MKPDSLVRDYRAACGKLAAALGKKEASELERAGAIQYFELAWKACKAKAEELGLTEVRSPRAALREAMVQGILGRTECGPTGRGGLWVL